MTKSTWTPVFDTDSVAYFQMKDGIKTIDEMSEEELEEVTKWFIKA